MAIPWLAIRCLKKKKSGQAVQIRHQFEAGVVEVLQALLASSKSRKVKISQFVCVDGKQDRKC